MRRLWGGVVLASIMLTGGFVSPSAAQVTYNVFPAQPPQPANEAQPTGPHGAAALVTLIVQDSTVRYVVHELTRQAHLQVLYNDSDPRIATRINLRAVNMRVMDALALSLQGTGLVAKLESTGETVVIRTPAGSAEVRHAHVALGVVEGRVTDSASGQGLGGAQVRVEGIKSLSTVTSDSGRFTLRDVPAGEHVLTARLFGYKPAERTITVVDSERTTVHIVMVPVPTVLSGVVTTATGLQRKVAVGNDITTLNVDSIMQVAPISNVTDLLETRVPGLTVLHSSGVPGAPSRIRLRGASSITGSNDPIIVVDGIRVYASQSDRRSANLAPGVGSNQGGDAIGYSAPSPLDQIDPSSIETIEVFKGPSASALYGSDAADGVIVITTKHGRAGPTHWHLALGQGINWLPGNWPVNYYRFGSTPSNNIGVPNIPLCAWNDLSCATDSIVAFQALNDPRYTVFSHGSDQTADLTVSGGVPTLTYSFTGSGSGDLGNLKLPAIEQQRYEKFYGPIPGYLVRPDNYSTWGVTGQLAAQPTQQVRVTLTSSLFNSSQQQGALQAAISQLEGEYIDPTQLASSPLIENDVERATLGSLTSNNAVTLNWQPFSWLPFSATGGLNLVQRTDQTLIPYGVNSCTPGNIQAYNLPNCGGKGGDTTGSYGLGRGTSQDNTVTVGTAIPALNNRVTLATGLNYHSGSTADVTAYTTQLSPGVTAPTSFPTLNGASSFFQQTSSGSTYGYYVEPRIKIFNTYISPGFRLDGGSASGANAGLTGFPKIDVSYVAVDRQSQRPLWGALTLLRPRLAFGYAGTEPAPADRLRLLNVNCLSAQQGSCGTQTVTLDDSTFVTIAQITSLGNTQLRPERTSELEGGLDADLWHGRFSMTYTLYNKTRHDAIIPIPVAWSVGQFADIDKNIGVVRNTGTELSMTATPIQTRALSWTVGANLSNDNNVVVRLNPGQSTIILPVNAGLPEPRVEAGYPLFGLFARPIVAFADANHNGIIEPNEIVYGDSAVYVGQPNPKYQLNVNTGLTLLNGRLSINATFAYQNGLTQTNVGAFTSGALALLPNTPGTSLATQAAIVAAGGVQVGQTFPSPTLSDIALIQRVNTFRFNALSINYTVPRMISSILRVPMMSIALQGENLGLHTNYRGLDPNVNAFSTVSVGDQTADTGQLPQPRTWWLKLSLGN